MQIEPIIITVTRDYNSDNTHYIDLDRALPDNISLYTIGGEEVILLKRNKAQVAITTDCGYVTNFKGVIPAGTKLEWRVSSKEVQCDLRTYNEPLSESDFNKYLNERLTEITETLQIKGKEYVRNSDRFHNFNTGSKLKQKPRELILDDYMFKHYVSYRDMLSDIENRNYPTEKHIKEKLGDLIVYFILQEIGLKQKLHDNNQAD